MDLGQWHSWRKNPALSLHSSVHGPRPIHDRLMLLLLTIFTARFMSYLASIGAIDEISKDSYAGNNVSRNLAERMAEAGISHW